MAEIVVTYNNVTGAMVAKKIDSSFLVSGILGSGYLADGAVTSSKVGSGQLAWPHIAAQGILSAGMASGQLAWPHFANAGIRSGNLASGQIWQAHLAANAILSAHISSGQIVDSHLASARFGLGRMPTGTSGQLFMGQGATVDPVYTDPNVTIVGPLNLSGDVRVSQQDKVVWTPFTSAGGAISSGVVKIAPVGDFRLLRTGIHLDAANIGSGDLVIQVDAAGGAAYDSVLARQDLSAGSLQDYVAVFGKGFEFISGDAIDAYWNNSSGRTYGLRFVHEMM